MTHDTTGPSDDREARINALLDGELGLSETEALKTAAGDDRELARAIIDAYRLQQALEGLRIERAPARLRRTLRRIPARHRPPQLQPRWLAAFAAVPLVVAVVISLQPTPPSAAELERAQRELAIAFHYLGQVSDRARNRIQHEVGSELSDAVAGSVVNSIPKPKSKETHA